MDNTLPLPEQDRLMTKLVREALGDRAGLPFHPVALYDKQRDRVEVHVRDCSYCEIWLNGVFYLFEDNYREKELIGFAVDCIHELVPGQRSVNVDHLLDEVSVRFPRFVYEIASARRLMDQLESKQVDLER